MSDKPTPRTKADTFKAIVKEPAISAGAFRLWHLLYHHANKDSECFPGYRAIQKSIHCHAASIRGWIEELCNAGLLVLSIKPTKRKDRYSHRYLVLDGLGNPINVCRKPETPTVTKTGNSQGCAGNRKQRCFRKPTQGVPETGNVTNTSPLRESVCSGVSVGHGEDQESVAPSGTDPAPAGAGRVVPPAKALHPAFTPGNGFPDDDEI